jgi:hypothetical protein
VVLAGSAVRPGRLPQRPPQPGTATACSEHLGRQPDCQPRPTGRHGGRPRLHHRSGRLAERVLDGAPRPLVGRRQTTLPDPAAHGRMGVRSAKPPARPALPRGGELRIPERVRQGDPLGPLLFALTLQGPLEQVAEMGLARPVAFADDTFLQGAREPTMRAFQVLTALAAPLGLCARPDKCAVYSEDTTAAASVATALGMHHAPAGLLAAGTPVGTAVSKRPVQLLAPTTPAPSWTGCKPGSRQRGVPRSLRRRTHCHAQWPRSVPTL